MHILTFNLHFLGLKIELYILQPKRDCMKPYIRCLLFIVLGILLIEPGHAQEAMTSFKLAVAQMRVVGGALDTNLEHARTLVNEAAGNGAQVVLLPEAMDLGWTDPSASFLAQPVPRGKSTQVLSSLAKKHQIYICSGLTELDGDIVYNSAVLIDPKGEVILLHRKINELDIGHEYYALGQSLRVVHTELGAIGVMICADASTGKHEIPRALSYMGADVILSPSAWAVPADYNNEKNPYGGMWRDIYSAVAKDFRVWIASCSNVGLMTGGPWKGWNAIGCSMVFAPGGRQALNAPYGANADTILYVDIKPEPRPGQGTTWHNYWKKKEGSTQD